MNHKVYFGFILVLLIGCTDKQETSPTIKITNELLKGRWILDSVGVVSEKVEIEDLFFHDGKMYRCTYYRDGYFIDSATFDNAAVKSYAGKKYALKLVDTNTLLIKSEMDRFYKKVRDDDVKASIGRYRTGDLFRKDYIGFWEPVNKVPTRVKILNTSPECNSVSFEIFNNGTAEFYIDQNKDSVVHHSFRVRDSMPQFINGCLVGDYDATWNKSRTRLGMLFSRFYPDTIWFKKVR